MKVNEIKRRRNTEGVSEQEAGETVWAEDRNRQLIYRASGKEVTDIWA